MGNFPAASRCGGQAPLEEQSLFNALEQQSIKIKFRTIRWCLPVEIARCEQRMSPFEDVDDRHVHLRGPSGGPAQVARAGATNVVNNLMSVIALSERIAL